jgi:RNA polymerase sigma factor (TIGR02999 family)
MGDVTQLLNAWASGDSEALDRLAPIIYQELCDQAHRYLRQERSDHTLETSGLVHEAYLRLIDQNRVVWQNRSHFYGIAARMMRRILVDHARRRRSGKRGSGASRVCLDEALLLPVERPPDLIALEDALSALEALEPIQVRIVEMRFFAGMSLREVADAVGLSTATVERRWRSARAWLYAQLEGCRPHDP